jgi:hypothetical protein
MDDVDDSVLVDEEVVTSPERSPPRNKRMAQAETTSNALTQPAVTVAASAPPRMDSSYSSFGDECDSPIRPAPTRVPVMDEQTHAKSPAKSITKSAIKSAPHSPVKAAPPGVPVPASPTAIPAQEPQMLSASPRPDDAAAPNVAASAVDPLTSIPELPRRPATCGVGGRPRHIAMGRRELLGKGTFGMVYRAMDLDTNRIIAVKEIIMAPGSSRPEQLEKLRREIAILQKLDHPNIVKCLGEHWDGQQHLRIFMEYVAGGTVTSMLRSFGPLSESQAARYADQMLRGLTYLHGKRIAHRDLKGDNLLVDVDGTLKLADFGTAKELATQSKSVAGTAFFMAPEMVKGVGHGIEADVWSAGCCIVEMLTGKPPFSHFSNQYAIMMHIAELAEGSFPVPPGASLSCKDFLRRCFRKDPAERATVAELLRHEWIVNPPLAGELKSINVISPSPASPEPLGDSTDSGASYNPLRSLDPS